MVEEPSGGVDLARNCIKAPYVTFYEAGNMTTGSLTSVSGVMLSCVVLLYKGHKANLKATFRRLLTITVC